MTTEIEQTLLQHLSSFTIKLTNTGFIARLAIGFNDTNYSISRFMLEYRRLSSQIDVYDFSNVLSAYDKQLTKMLIYCKIHDNDDLLDTVANIMAFNTTHNQLSLCRQFDEVVQLIDKNATNLAKFQLNLLQQYQLSLINSI